MKKRWQVSEDNIAFIREVNPSNGAKLKITESRDLDAGQIFYRKKISGGILFAEKADYEYFRGFERMVSGRCQPLYIRLQFYCHGLWQTFWTGEFSTGAGKWNLDECTFEVKPETVDRYSCLLRKQGVKKNVLTAPIVTVNIPVLSSWEFGVCSTTGVTPSPAGDCDAFYGPGGQIGDPYIDGWDAATTSQSVTGGQVNFYWRERVRTECVGGLATPPPGSGWLLVEDDCATDGTALYARQPIVSWPFDAPQVGTVVGAENVPPDDTCQWVFMGMGGIEDPFNPGSELLPYYVCIDSAETTELDTARTMKEAIEVIIEGTGCDLLGIRSDLFNWNPVGDALNYEAGIDYVTGLPSVRSNLLIAQKSDVIDPDATNPATIGEWTMKDVATFFLALNCFWDIDEDGYYRVEHWDYWTSVEGVTIADLTKPNEPLAYEHLSDSVPGVERLQFMEALSRDFVGRDIEYSGPCVGVDNEDEKEYSAGKVTTDVTYILTDPGAIAKEGFVVLATTPVGADYTVIISQGAITGDFLSNGSMSTANIQNDYWRSRRYLRTGSMNGVDTAFEVRDNIEQGNVRGTLCCETLRYSANDTIVTQLGQRLGGINANVESVEYDIFADRITWTLRYAY